MYGTRKEMTHELKRVFEAGEPLALLVWTAESVKAMAQSQGITDAEAESVLARIGTIPMQEYQQKGVSCETVFNVLAYVRAKTRPVNVPADMLESLVLFAEQALEIESCIAQDEQIPIPESVIQGKVAVEKVNALLKN